MGHLSAPAELVTTALPKTWTALIWTSVKTTLAMSMPRVSTPSGPTLAPVSEDFQQMAPSVRILMSALLQVPATHGPFAQTSLETTFAPVSRVLKAMASPVWMWMSALSQIPDVRPSQSASTPLGLMSVHV